MRKSGSATTTVATHLCLAAIGIKELPLEISLFRPLDEDDAIRTYGGSPLTDLPRKPLHAILPHEGLPMIDEDEVISASAHLHERNLHQNKPPSLTEFPETTEQDNILLVCRDFSRQTKES